MLKKKVSISLMRVFFGISVKTALALEPQNELVLDFFFLELKTDHAYYSSNAMVCMSPLNNMEWHS